MHGAGRSTICAAPRGAWSNELERQILPDGGHISRNPGVIIEILLDLLPLSQAFTARNVAPPPALINAIDRMMPMLRFFRHGDGTFALFNGMGPTPPDLLATVLAYDDARGTPVANAPYSGYQRIDAGATVVLMDTGGPPPPEVSGDAHAGCLAFEFSSQAAAHRRQLRHAGQRQGELAPGRARDRGAFHRHLQRHLVVPVSRLDRVPPAVRRARSWTGRSNVTVARDTEERRRSCCAPPMTATPSASASSTSASSRCRRTATSSTARTSSCPPTGKSLPEDALDHFAVRFHLHPSIRVNRLTDGHGAVLLLPNKDVWNLDTHEDEVVLEESVYLAGHDGPRRTTQVVIYGRAREINRVHWTFSHVPHLAPGAKRQRGPEPELPL